MSVIWIRLLIYRLATFTVTATLHLPITGYQQKDNAGKRHGANMSFACDDYAIYDMNSSLLAIQTTIIDIFSCRRENSPAMFYKS